MSTPLNQAHEFLWSVIDSCKELDELVPYRNRVKLLSFYNPELVSVQSEVDTPRIEVYLGNMAFGLDMASNTSLVNVQFLILVIISGLDIQPLLEIVWALIKAILYGRRHVVSPVYDINVEEGQIKIEPIARLSLRATLPVDVKIDIESSESLCGGE